MINVGNATTGSSEPYLYRGEDCMDKFVERMNEVREDVIKNMKQVKDRIETEKDWEDFNNATKCFICGNAFQEDEKKCWDHCHFTGKCRGCAHEACNLRFSMSLSSFITLKLRRSLNHQQGTRAEQEC